MNRSADDRLGTYLRKARAVLLAAEALSAAARAAIALLALLCLSLLCDRVFDLAFSTTLAIAALPAALVWIAAALLVRSFAMGACAGRVDRAFRLEERLSTAWEILSRGNRDGIAAAQIEDAAAAAERIGISRIFAQTAHGIAGRAGVVAVLSTVAAVLILLPGRSPAFFAEGDETVQRAILAASRKIDDAVKATPAEAATRPEIKQLLESLSRLTTAAANRALTARTFEERLREIAREIAAVRSINTLTPGEALLLKELADRAAAAGNGYAAEMQRHGIVAAAGRVPEETLRTLDRLREEDRKEGMGDGGIHASAASTVSNLFTRPPEMPTPNAGGLVTVDTILKSLASPSWPIEYGDPIRRYYADAPK